MTIALNRMDCLVTENTHTSLIMAFLLVPQSDASSIKDTFKNNLLHVQELLKQIITVNKGHQLI